MVDCSGFESRRAFVAYRGFESHLLRQFRNMEYVLYALVAQLVEHLICNQVAGSSRLSGGTTFKVLKSRRADLNRKYEEMRRS